MPMIDFPFTGEDKCTIIECDTITWGGVSAKKSPLTKQLSVILITCIITTYR